ncbi:fibroblast growth factor 18 [Pseudomyrmex gracilis]|uniref:fibroblast growth factor 18 n=1 Tax=Pseudomyrmex gracilis TaxID=219809 RepID=UPI000994C8F2|nr:fibroblast growth factor 18 [Pseudomyrmex gracilis]
MFVIRLPQLAVLAKILCLLMVVMCGAVPAMVRSVSLYSTCSSGNVTVTHRSIVAAGRTELNAPYQMLTTQSEDFSRKLYIFAEKIERYICFTKKWKLVSRRNRGPMCQFYEFYNGSYLRYRSVKNESRYIGFNKNGRPVRNPHARQQCFNFIKYNPHADINHHNSVLNAEIGGMGLQYTQRKTLSTTEVPNNFRPGSTRGHTTRRHRHSYQKMRQNRSHSVSQRRQENRHSTVIDASKY